MTVPIGKTAQIDLFTGPRFGERMTQEYTVYATVQGEVRSANLDNRTFSIRLKSGSKVIGKFEKEHERLLVDALHDYREGLTRMEVKAVFEPEVKTFGRITIFGAENYDAGFSFAFRNRGRQRGSIRGAIGIESCKEVSA